MQRTIGLDFGTHQTKVCIEEKERLETRYSFLTFKDRKGEDSYVLPSIIRINTDEKLSYGYIKEGEPGTIVRYFKQATFTENPSIWMSRINAEYFTIWYLAYIIFLLEEKYGTVFSLNFGIPTDNDRYNLLKKKAVILVTSAYNLVENVYENNIERFLNESITTLKENTEILPYSDENKEDYGILIFPEAFACLRPLAAKGRITDGMNLMVDIGGGTTDISFFTMEKEEKTGKLMPQIYELLSAPLGLNFLTKAEEHLDSGKIDSNVNLKTELDGVRLVEYTDEIANLCYRLRKKIIHLYDNSTQLYRDRVVQALKNRLIIYTGGGSTFPKLRRAYDGFTDIKYITINEWGTQSFDEMLVISKLCPILSTVFGLSISAATDTLEIKPLHQLFAHLKEAEEGAYDDLNLGPSSKSYKNNWMNKEYGVLGADVNYTSSKKKVKPTTDSKKNIPNILPALLQNQKRDSIAKLPKGEVHVPTISPSEIDKDELPSRMGVFTLTNHSKTKCEYYGKVIIRDGLAYDIYYDNSQNLIVDFLYFEGKKCQRKTLLAVSVGSPLSKSIKKYGCNKIKSITRYSRVKKKKNKVIVKITIDVSGPQYPKGSDITYTTSYSTE